MKNFGIIKNAVNHDQLKFWKDIYKKGAKHSMDMSIVVPIKDNVINDDPCWGIDVNSLAYAWSLKNVMPIIWKNFNKDEKMIYSAYKDMTSPFGIHRDLKPLPRGAEGVRSLSVLFPLSTDGTVDNMHKVGTNFFDNDRNLLECITWEPGAVIWWRSEVLHSASDFRTEGIRSKQFYITHTYV
jgi:hypothetical protein